MIMKKKNREKLFPNLYPSMTHYETIMNKDIKISYSSFAWWNSFGLPRLTLQNLQKSHNSPCNIFTKTEFGNIQR